jgi:hypothetical protein
MFLPEVAMRNSIPTIDTAIAFLLPYRHSFKEEGQQPRCRCGEYHDTRFFRVHSERFYFCLGGVCHEVRHYFNYCTGGEERFVHCRQRQPASGSTSTMG